MDVKFSVIGFNGQDFSGPEDAERGTQAASLFARAHRHVSKSVTWTDSVAAEDLLRHSHYNSSSNATPNAKKQISSAAAAIQFSVKQMQRPILHSDRFQKLVLFISCSDFRSASSSSEKHKFWKANLIDQLERAEILLNAIQISKNEQESQIAGFPFEVAALSGGKTLKVSSLKSKEAQKKLVREVLDTREEQKKIPECVECECRQTDPIRFTFGPTTFGNGIDSVETPPSLKCLPCSSE